MKLADGVQKSHPLTAQILRQKIYVFDVLAGINYLITTKSSGKEQGFALRKWTSNHPHILKEIPQSVQ